MNLAHNTPIARYDTQHPERIDGVWPLSEGQTRFALETAFQTSFVTHPFVVTYNRKKALDFKNEKDPMQVSLSVLPHDQLDAFVSLKNFDGMREFTSLVLRGSKDYRSLFVEKLENRFSPHFSYEYNTKAGLFPPVEVFFSEDILEQFKGRVPQGISFEELTFKYFFELMLEGSYTSFAFDGDSEALSLTFDEYFNDLSQYLYLTSFPYFTKGKYAWGKWFVRLFMHLFPHVATKMPVLLPIVHAGGTDRDLYLVNPDLTGEEALELDPDGLSSMQVVLVLREAGNQKLGDYFETNGLGCLYASKLDHPFVPDGPAKREQTLVRGYKLHIKRCENLKDFSADYFDDYIDAMTPAEEKGAKTSHDYDGDTDEEVRTNKVMKGTPANNVKQRADLAEDFGKWRKSAKPFRPLSPASISALYSGI